MDPITSAIAIGAAAGLKDGAAQAVRDAYRALKAALTTKYPRLDIKPVEDRPASQVKRESLSEDLVEAGADRDSEVLERAAALIESIRREDPQAGVGIGVDLERIRAQFLTIERVGGGVKAREVETQGGITITDIDSGGAFHPNH